MERKLKNKISTARWEARNPKVTVRMTAEEVDSLRRIADAARLKPNIVAAKLIRFALETLEKQQQLDRFKSEVEPSKPKKLKRDQSWRWPSTTRAKANGANV